MTHVYYIRFQLKGHRNHNIDVVSRRVIPITTAAHVLALNSEIMEQEGASDCSIESISYLGSHEEEA